MSKPIIHATLRHGGRTYLLTNGPTSPTDTPIRFLKGQPVQVSKEVADYLAKQTVEITRELKDRVHQNQVVRMFSFEGEWTPPAFESKSYIVDHRSPAEREFEEVEAEAFDPV